MGFLDNSGDIIIDAVLTDAGRERLARGDGTFKITKFALGDDEINYELYDLYHPSGSAYQDIEILQTPVLEAPTDNGGALKHKLISISRNDLLYLPVLKLNEIGDYGRMTTGPSSGSFVVCTNEVTEDLVGNNKTGVMFGENPANSTISIRVDQGLDTTEISYTRTLDNNLVETRYIVEIDNRLGQLVDKDGNLISPNYIDDDNIASYNLPLTPTSTLVKENDINAGTASHPIRGPRGTFVNFKILSSLDLRTSDFYFGRFGGSTTITGVSGATVDVNYIDTYVRVFGATTGRSVDIPVRYIRSY